MKILKVKDVKTPERGTAASAGLDFFVPFDFPGTHYLASNQSINIPSGIKAKVPKGYALIVMNKSGVALKKGLQVGACVVDEDYQGEIHLHVVNIGSDVAEIKPGEKLVQMLLVPVLYEGIEIAMDESDLFGDEKTERGEGGFGSTGVE
jgi:dUTP pyrophosphatase